MSASALEGVSVVAEGLNGNPVLNSSGLFVWLDEDFSRLKRLVIEPGLQPYSPVVLARREMLRRRMNDDIALLIQLIPVALAGVAVGERAIEGRADQSGRANHEPRRPGLLCGGRASKAGLTRIVTRSSQPSEIISSLPMLAVPGWLDSHRAPNAVAVTSALKTTARIRLDASIAVSPARHAVTK